jgi:hypothetical protein
VTLPSHAYQGQAQIDHRIDMFRNDDPWASGNEEAV